MLLISALWKQRQDIANTKTIRATQRDLVSKSKLASKQTNKQKSQRGKKRRDSNLVATFTIKICLWLDGSPGHQRLMFKVPITSFES